MTVLDLIQVIEVAGLFSGYRMTQRKECLNLVRRLKLLMPLLEEIADLDPPLPVESPLICLVQLNKALHSVKKLLKFCTTGSKIFLALESESVIGRFHAVYDKLSQALDDIPFDELGVSVEAKEQIELMRMQLKRAKGRADTQDIELAMDLMVVMSARDGQNAADSVILERLANKLDLLTIADLKAETIAVRKLIKQRGGHISENLQQVIDLLRKFKQIVGIAEASSAQDAPVSPSTGPEEDSPSRLIPNEFLCPITLEIMTEPVIVATGQTYERVSIQKWLDSNHRTCPKTGQTLSHLSVAPNYALRNLIVQWCEKNNFQLPKRDAYSGTTATAIVEEITLLVQNLSSDQPAMWRDAVMKIRKLSKETSDSRFLIANVGGVPSLVRLLSDPDTKIQEHAVTALLNLSIDEANKRLIATHGAIPPIIDILQNGTDEARENSAAALFSLSTLDENKALVGSLNGIPPLVNLLQNGSSRGKKDAATALFNLSLNQANKLRAIKAGIVPPLLHLLRDKNLGMVDEALSILLLLVSHPEGQEKVGACISLVETLVEIIGNGTPRNKECATSVLLQLGSNDLSIVLAAVGLGVHGHLVEIAKCGTNRAQRKANSLLLQISKCSPEKTKFALAANQQMPTDSHGSSLL